MQRFPESISDNYEALKKRIAEILEDPANEKIHADFQKLVDLMQNAPIPEPLIMDKEGVIGCLAQVILLSPINEALFPDHPFFNEQTWTKLLENIDAKR